jgi:hypothetical protein
MAVRWWRRTIRRVTDGSETPRGSQVLPVAGTPTLAGVALPPGRPVAVREGGDAVMWSTDDVVDDAHALAVALAEAWPVTGLWPLLWEWAQEPASSYCSPWGIASADAIDAVQAGAVIARRWSEMFSYLGPEEPMPGWAAPFTREPPGLAPGQCSPDRASAAPFRAHLAAHGRARCRLLLVPCRQPADALAAMGWDGPQEIELADLAAILRSWEKRFGAVPVAFSPAALQVAVAAPPTKPDQALLLAVEHYTFADIESGGVDHGLAAYAAGLRGALPPEWTWFHGDLSWFDVDPSCWEFGWP